MNYWDYTGGGDYLSHHGILGMKHGVRNGPPYPLGGSIKSTLQTFSAVSRGLYNTYKDTSLSSFKSTAQTFSAVGKATWDTCRTKTLSSLANNPYDRYSREMGSRASRYVDAKHTLDRARSNRTSMNTMQGAINDLLKEGSISRDSAASQLNLRRQNAYNMGWEGNHKANYARDKLSWEATNGRKFNKNSNADHMSLYNYRNSGKAKYTPDVINLSKTMNNKRNLEQQTMLKKYAKAGRQIAKDSSPDTIDYWRDYVKRGKGTYYSW